MTFNYTVLDGQGGTDTGSVSIDVQAPIGDIIGTEGNDDPLAGTIADDTIRGLGGDDVLLGYDGDDIMYGGAGNDRFYDYDGNDTMYGEDGDDIFFVALGAEIIDGGAGIDTVDYDLYYRSWGMNLDLSAGTAIRIGGTLVDTLSNIENITGSDQADIIIGDAGVNVLRGASGGDDIHGMDGDDTIYGDSGSDTIYGDGGNDVIRGNSGQDTLHGGDGNDELRGGSGSDILYGEDGLDSLWGDGGADTFVFNAGSGFNNIDVIQDFSLADGDAIDISDILLGYDPLADAISDFIQITDNGTDSVLSVDADGGADNFVQIATLTGVTSLTDEDALEVSGALVTV